MRDGITMLIIDDDGVDQRFLNEVLSAQFPKLSLTFVRGIRNGIASFRQQLPDIVVTGCKVGARSESLRLVEEISSENAGTAVIMITDGDTPVQSGSFPKLPFFRVITKPVPVDRLLSAVVEAVGVIITMA